MTLDEFLDDYVPRVLKPMGGWFLTPRGYVMRDSEREWCCPLTATRDKDSQEFQEEAEWLQLSGYAAEAIVAASDNDDSDPAIRARLLAGLGLTERTA